MACRTRAISNCGNGKCTTRQVVSSNLVYDGKYRAVKYSTGCCDLIPKGYIPQSYNTPDRSIIKNNGPIIIGCRWGIGGSTESECMDCLNYIYNACEPVRAC